MGPGMPVTALPIHRPPQTPMWVDDETEELSASSCTGTMNKTTHRRRASTTSLSSYATNPPSSADDDSGKETAPSRSLAPRHQPISDSEDDSAQLSKARPSKKSTTVYGYRHTGQKPQKKSRAQAAREAEVCDRGPAPCK